MSASHSTDGSVTQIINHLRAGDAAAAEEIWKRYFPRLLGLARKTLTGIGGQAADAEDPLQSAFFSFWKRATRGDFVGDLDRNGAWRLLATITVRKVLKQREREQAQKRGGGREVNEAAFAGREPSPRQLDDCLAAVSPPDFDLSCEESLLKLDVEPRAVVLLRLMSYSNREIAGILSYSERKVERKLQIARLTWDRENMA